MRQAVRVDADEDLDREGREEDELHPLEGGRPLDLHLVLRKIGEARANVRGVAIDRARVLGDDHVDEEHDHVDDDEAGDGKLDADVGEEFAQHRPARQARVAIVDWRRLLLWRHLFLLRGALRKKDNRPDFFGERWNGYRRGG